MSKFKRKICDEIKHDEGFFLNEGQSNQLENLLRIASSNENHKRIPMLVSFNLSYYFTIISDKLAERAGLTQDQFCLIQ